MTTNSARPAKFLSFLNSLIHLSLVFPMGKSGCQSTAAEQCWKRNHIGDCYKDVSQVIMTLFYSPTTWKSLASNLLVEVLLYVHRNRRLIRDGSSGRPPRFSHSSWALSIKLASTVSLLIPLSLSNSKSLPLVVYTELCAIRNSADQ